MDGGSQDHRWALKLKTIKWARSKGLDQILTGNDMENQHMLSINIPLGYKAIPARLEVVRDLETERVTRAG